MPFRSEIAAKMIEARDSAERFVNNIVSKYPSIVSVALVGSWSRGIFSPTDMDFVVILQNNDEIKRISSAKDLRVDIKLQTTLIFYTLNRIMRIAFCRKAPLGIIKLARLSTRIFRKHTELKKILILILGSYKMFFQQFEILPQTLQTWIPLHDRSDILRRIQKTQRIFLEKRLTPFEQILYRPNGFYHLIEQFLSQRIDAEAIKNVLLNSDFEWKTYLKRIQLCYDGLSAEKIAELCRR